MPNDEIKADCYSAGERKWMELGQRIRSALLAPLLRLLNHCNISPDQITFASLACGIFFVPLWLSERYWMAVVMLIVHVLLDGIDGPLARFQNVDSQRGSFTDSFCDQIVVSVVSIALMNDPQSRIDIWGGSLFVLLYVGVLAMSMVRNALQAPYSWLVRPRFFVFASTPIELVGVTNAIAWTIWVSNALLAIKAASGFIKLRQRLPGKR